MHAKPHAQHIIFSLPYRTIKYFKRIHEAEGGDHTRLGFFVTHHIAAWLIQLVRDINLHNLRIFTVS